jgi:phosphate transport system permease protein
MAADRHASDAGQYHYQTERRRRIGRIWRAFFKASTATGILVLALLALNIGNMVVGLVAVEYERPPSTLAVAGAPFEELDHAALTSLLAAHIPRRVYDRLDRERAIADRSEAEVRALVWERVVEPKVVASWTLWQSVSQRAAIEAQIADRHPAAVLRYSSWLTRSFVVKPQSATPELAGVRTAILGSLWTILITIVVAFPLGAGAALYLEEYATQGRLSRIIRTNINNLAGVPSIIYGMLGLAIFVRLLGPVTSGAVFGFADASTANGRTVASAGLTLALLILPLIIINGQEAVRAVPTSLREASYALGATKWQTIFHHVLPTAFPGILTGSILAVSRAIGETAPLVVIGAATYITVDPSGPFSKFTTLPNQIYQWTARPQSEFRHLSAAAIVVLLAMLLTLNSVAVVLRNRYRTEL